MERINRFLDQHVLPWPVRFLSHRFVILLTIALLIPLVVFANNQVLVLLINSYLNTMSVAVSSIVLLYATIAEIHQKQIADLQETRAQEDHLHLVEMHILMQQSLANQREEIAQLRKMVSELLGREYQAHPSGRSVDLRSLHPGGAARFRPGHMKARMADMLHRHLMTESVHQALVDPKRHQ